MTAITTRLCASHIIAHLSSPRHAIDDFMLPMQPELSVLENHVEAAILLAASIDKKIFVRDVWIADLTSMQCRVWVVDM